MIRKMMGLAMLDWRQKVAVVVLSTVVFVTQHSAAAEVKLAASIQPWGLILAELLGFDSSEQAEAEIVVIVPPGSSPHHYHLRLSTRRQIEAANLMVWSGEMLEPFLAKAVAGLPPERVLNISALPSIAPTKSSMAVDAHSWLSPEKGLQVAEALASRLVELYPEKIPLISERLAAFKARVTALDQRFVRQLKPLQGQGFIVYHNAFDLLVERYGLRQLGVVQPNEERRPSVRHRLDLERKKDDAVCLFGELELEHGNGAKLATQWQLKFIQLDHLGNRLSLGANRYSDLLEAIVEQMVDCLSSD